MRQSIARLVQEGVARRAHTLGRRAVLRSMVLGPSALALVGCAAGQTRLTPPAEGLRLRYRFTPGDRHHAHVEHQHRTELWFGDLFSIKVVAKIRARVSVTVSALTETGAQLVARVADVKLDWGSIARGSTLASAKTQVTRDLNGAEFDVTVDDRGVVQSMPEIPADMPEALAKGVGQMLAALRLTFFEVPGPALPPKDPLVLLDEKKNLRKAVHVVLYSTDARGRQLSYDSVFDAELRQRSAARIRGYYGTDTGPLVKLEGRSSFRNDLIETYTGRRGTASRVDVRERVEFSLGEQFLRTRRGTLKVKLSEFATHEASYRVRWTRP